LKKIVAVILAAFLCISNVYGSQQTSAYSIQINAAARILRLYKDGTLVKEYPVAVGKPTTKTPIGNFTIINKAKNPVWHNKGNPVAPGPRNPLGIRWMGISAPRGTYGIHGNNVPTSISTYASGGCIRMFNSDVEELYDIVPVSTPVRIIYENIELKQDIYSNGAALIVYPDIYRQKNAEDILKKIIANHSNITQVQRQKALKLALSNLTKPVAVAEGASVFINNQFMTSDAFIEENQVYLYFMAGVERLGIDGSVMAANGISVKEKNSKVYINLTEAISKLGGKLTVDTANNNAYISISIVKVNGIYLSSYKGGFDKEYSIEASILKDVSRINIADAKMALDAKEFCKQQSWQLKVDSMNKMIEIQVPLKVKIADAYYSAVSYNGRYYIDSEAAAGLEDLQNQRLNVYSYENKDYYDIYEIMQKYECNQDAFFTTVEVVKLVKSEI